LSKTVLPPDVSAASFAAALEQFERAIGAEWVFSNSEDLELYRDPYSFFWDTPDERLASAALAPATVAEVQKIVRIANQYKTPLYPISTGRNLTYGTAAPVMGGSIVVDLKRLNKIITVDDKRHYALVEPGVSYFDLYRYIQDHGLKVWIDCAEAGWGGPVGNALDHGVGLTTAPYRDHFGAHCGMEVVLPDGELMRTGMGAMPNGELWQEFKYGQGPWVDGLFGQGNFGIVTKMGFWLMPQPEAQFSGRVYFPRYSDLQALIEHLDYLENLGLIGYPSLDSPMGAETLGFGQAGQADRPLEELMAHGWPSRDRIEAFCDDRGGPVWRLTLRFYGSEETVKAGWAYARRRIAGSVTGVTFEDGNFYHLPLTAEERQKEHLAHFGIPSLQLFKIVEPDLNNGEPLDGHADFWAVLPRSAAGLLEGQRVIFETQRRMGVKPTFNPFSCPQMFYARSFNLGYSLATFRSDPEANKKGLALYNALVVACAEAGFPQYRSNIYTQELAASFYSFNGHSLQRFREVLKDAADPNGIMAPGRYGIWPKRLRASKAEPG
jgi:(+)-pinoresinol hydroxylase